MPTFTTPVAKSILGFSPEELSALVKSEGPFAKLFLHFHAELIVSLAYISSNE